MNNFLRFIDEDIEAKKTLISTLPTNTKLNKRKYNEKIEEIINKYSLYKKSLKKYILSKNKKLEIKKQNKNTDELSSLVANLEHVRFILNPQNTYYEKMGFDNLIYQISNYSDFKFDSLDNIINSFLDKFELLGIKLESKNFNYNVYVKEYMTAFLDVRNKKSNNYSIVSEKFEQIYWINPDLISHIELNFRKLIKDNSKKFDNYVKKIQLEIKNTNQIKDYSDCMKKLQDAYTNLNIAEDETISDIILMFKTGNIDINHYLLDSKIRNEAYSTLSIDSLNFDDKSLMKDFYTNIEKLKLNITEYSNYKAFIPLVKNFKNEYEKFLNGDKINNLKQKEKEIISLEKKLYKLNKKIYSRLSNKEKLKQLKQESIKLSNELYCLYGERDTEYFKSKVLPKINLSFTISDLLEFYYSFDYFKKVALKKVFKLSNYEELIQMSDSFDLFAMNPTNMIMRGVLIFEKFDVDQVIVNKYRLSNINLSLEELNSDDMDFLLNKINMILRIKKIEESSTSIDNIWFMVKASIIDSEMEKD